MVLPRAALAKAVAMTVWVAVELAVAMAVAVIAGLAALLKLAAAAAAVAAAAVHQLYILFGKVETAAAGGNDPALVGSVSDILDPVDFAAVQFVDKWIETNPQESCPSTVPLNPELVPVAKAIGSFLTTVEMTEPQCLGHR